MKIPFIVILRNGEFSTIHQTTPATKTIDFLDLISSNLAGEPEQPTQAEIDKACKEGVFKLTEQGIRHQPAILSINLVEVEVNTEQPGFASHAQERLHRATRR